MVPTSYPNRLDLRIFTDIFVSYKSYNLIIINNLLVVIMEINMNSKLFNPRKIGLLIIILILSSMIYGFAAANTLTVNPLGDATGTVSGYTVTVSFDFFTADSDPSDVETASLVFTTAPNKAYTRVWDNNNSVWSAWVDCGGDGATTTLSCTLPANTLTVDLTQVQVAAR